MYLLVIALVVLADHLVKYLISTSMVLESSVTVIPGVFDITYIRNTGAAYGMFAGKQTLLLVVTAVIMIGISVYVAVNRKKILRAEKLSLALIVGGGLGNFISRAYSGDVVDFLNIHIIPIFNIADIAVCVGCALLVLVVLWIEPQKEKKALAAQQT